MPLSVSRVNEIDARQRRNSWLFCRGRVNVYDWRRIVQLIPQLPLGLLLQIVSKAPTILLQAAPSEHGFATAWGHRRNFLDFCLLGVIIK